MSTFSEGRLGHTPEDQNTDRPRGWKPTMEQPVPPVRCSERTDKGTQCNQWSVTGSTRCNIHASPLDMKEAQERVMAGRLRMIGLIDPAIDTLQELLEPGTGEAVRLKAATEILDRSGVVKGQDINIQVEQTNRGAEIVAERLAAIRARKKADDEIISVEEVTEDDDS